MTKPLGKYLLIKKVKTKVESGIILPDSVKSLEEDGVEYVVEAVGSLCELGLEIGDKLIFRPERTVIVTVDEENDLHIIPESCIIGVK